MAPFKRPGATLADIEAIYRQRFSEFCNVAAAILHDRERARDAVQDAFANAVRNRRGYRGEGPLDAWLWRVVVNTALAELRRPAAVVEGRSENGAGHDDELDDVRAAIQSLPERQRLVLFLRYWADLDYQAIADVLAIAPGTVAASLHAAHRSVRNRLQEVHT